MRVLHRGMEPTTGCGRKIDRSAEALQVCHHLLIFPSKENNCIQYFAGNRKGKYAMYGISTLFLKGTLCEPFFGEAIPLKTIALHLRCSQ